MGKLIGDAGNLRLELMGRQHNDLGYILAARLHGQGMATDHTVSRRVAEKLGTSLVATFRNARNGDFESCLYGARADGKPPAP